MLHSTAVTKQWTSKRPYIANAVFRIVQNHGEKSYFRRFQGGDHTIAPRSAPDSKYLKVNSNLR